MSQESIFPVLIHFSSIAAVSFYHRRVSPLADRQGTGLSIRRARGRCCKTTSAPYSWELVAAGRPARLEGFSADIYADEIGIGRGVADRLRELNYSVKPFNASKRPTTEQRQFTYANLRAEAYARMRGDKRNARQVPEQQRQAPDHRQGRLAADHPRSAGGSAATSSYNVIPGPPRLGPSPGLRFSQPGARRVNRR